MQEAAKDSGGSRLTKQLPLLQAALAARKAEPLHRTSILSKREGCVGSQFSDARFALFNIKWDIASPRHAAIAPVAPMSQFY